MFRIPDGKYGFSPPSTKRRKRRRQPSKQACERQKAKRARRALYALAFVLGACLVISSFNNLSLALAAAVAYVIVLIKDYLEKIMKSKMNGDLLLSLVMFMLLGATSVYIVQNVIHNPGGVVKVLNQIASSTPFLTLISPTRTVTPEATHANRPPTASPIITIVPYAVPTKRPSGKSSSATEGPEDPSPTDPPPTDLPPSGVAPTDPPTTAPTEPSATESPQPTDPPPTEAPKYGVYHKYEADGSCKEKEFPLTAKPQGWEAGKC